MRPFISSDGLLFLDLDAIAIATLLENGQLLVYLKNSSSPIIINSEQKQSSEIINSITQWNELKASRGE